jgi:hypothetical protein
MICKTDQIRAAWAAGDRIGALRIVKLAKLAGRRRLTP